MLVFDAKGNLISSSGFGKIGAETKAMCLVDMNRDGTPDLVLGNYNGGSLVYFIKNNRGTLEFTNAYTYLFNIDRTTSIGCADFNGDGLTDFIVGTETSDHNAYLQYSLLMQRSSH
jgi:hypothetical protein